MSPTEGIKFCFVNTEEIQDNKFLTSDEAADMIFEKDKSSTWQKIPTLSDELKKNKGDLQQYEAKESEVDNIFGKLNLDT